MHLLVVQVGPCAHEWAGIKHRTGVPATAAGDAEAGTGGPAASLNPADDPGDSCLICQFSIQAKLPPESRSLTRGEAFRPLRAAVAPPTRIPAASLPSQPLAPPVLADSHPLPA